MMKLIAIIMLFFAFLSHEARADKYEISLSFDHDYDADGTDIKSMVEVKQRDEENLYRNEFSLYFEQSKDANHNKTKDLLDYEHNFKYFLNGDKKFMAAYYRNKNDEFLVEGDDQNYQIFTIGSGIETEIEQHTASFELYIGERTGAENIEIIRPSLSIKRKLDNYSYKIQTAYIRGANFMLSQSKVETKYFLSKNLHVKYLIRYEESQEIDGSITRERRNLLSLGLNF